jgi:hypothetical protein
MYDLPKVMPDPEMVLALQPEELGAKLLFLMQARTKREAAWMPIWPIVKVNHSPPEAMACSHILINTEMGCSRLPP